ncbi:MAG: sigma-54-dependent Fis family transcriptional regulator [Fibrobacter sp.]|nr:sigma-54-dependent Fis family transcriptional regulator [Fibrobacter sp.]
MKILICDKDQVYSSRLLGILSEHAVYHVQSSSDAYELIRKDSSFQILIIDFNTLSSDNLDLLKILPERLPLYRAVLLVSFSSKSFENELLAENLAHAVIQKNNNTGIIIEYVNRLVSEIDNGQSPEIIDNISIDTVPFQSKNKTVIHASRVMSNLLDTAKKYAASSATVRISGENGVGKEVIADFLHKNSVRNDYPMIHVNCAAIPESLFESELFGHIRGSFTGAISNRKGLFELADKGTIFLDEIGEIPLSLQAKLLRVLESKQILPIGSPSPVTVDVKIICATNRSLSDMVANGEFRQDLYHRLNQLILHVPALRERTSDIPLLASFFLNQISMEEGVIRKEFTSEALAALSKRVYPGNVRELKSLVLRLYWSTNSTVIDIHDINNEGINGSNYRKSDIPNDLFSAKLTYNEFRDLADKEFLTRQLMQNNYNVTLTANSIAMIPTNLSRKLKDLGVDVRALKGA